MKEVGTFCGGQSDGQCYPHLPKLPQLLVGGPSITTSNFFIPSHVHYSHYHALSYSFTLFFCLLPFSSDLKPPPPSSCMRNVHLSSTKQNELNALLLSRAGKSRLTYPPTGSSKSQPCDFTTAMGGQPSKILPGIVLTAQQTYIVPHHFNQHHHHQGPLDANPCRSYSWRTECPQ